MAKSSKKDTSVIVSAPGVLMSINTALVSAVRKQGGTDADIYRLATPEGESLIEKIAALIVQAGKPIEQLAENCYKVLVDYGQTLQQMIVNGKYDANSDITTSNFPMQRSGQQDIVIELVHFGQGMSSEEVLKEFEASGLRVATLPELLAFGATYPEKQREFPIVALGSVWQARSDSCDVPSLDVRDSKRGLHMVWDGGKWNGLYRFAGIRKYPDKENMTRREKELGRRADQNNIFGPVKTMGPLERFRSYMGSKS